MFEDEHAKSMDFGPGETYKVYISYFLGQQDDTNTDTRNKVFGGEVDGSGQPIFKDIYINKLKGVYD